MPCNATKIYEPNKIPKKIKFIFSSSTKEELKKIIIIFKFCETKDLKFQIKYSNKFNTVLDFIMNQSTLKKELTFWMK